MDGHALERLGHYIVSRRVALGYATAPTWPTASRSMIISMFMRRDKHSFGAASFKAGNLKPDWPNHGL
jgi:hypothetical protein